MTALRPLLPESPHRVFSRAGERLRRPVRGGLAASLVASVVGVPGFVLVPELAWAVLSTVTLLVLTLADTRLTPPPA